MYNFTLSFLPAPQLCLFPIRHEWESHLTKRTVAEAVVAKLESYDTGIMLNDYQTARSGSFIKTV